MLALWLINIQLPFAMVVPFCLLNQTMTVSGWREGGVGGIAHTEGGNETLGKCGTFLTVYEGRYKDSRSSLYKQSLFN